MYIEIDKKKHQDFKEHYIEIVSPTKEGWAVGCGSRKEKVDNSLWAWVEGLNKGKKRVVVRESFSEEMFGLRNKNAQELTR